MNKFENEKEQLDRQLQRLYEVKCIGLIAGNIIHSFNNVIGVIRGYADLALRATSSRDRSHAYLKQVIEGVDSAKDLAEKLRIFTKQKKPDFRLIGIHPIVEQTIKTFRESLPAPIDIQQDIDATSAAVLADAGQIQQMVINLCDNAYDAACENGGIIKIILKEVDVGAFFAAEYKCLNEGRYVKFTLSDTGHGMDQNISKQVYEPFFTTKEIRGNAGLGLSVVHEIVKGHKGEIIVESKVGEGTTFDVYLPLAGNDNEKMGE